jgi:2-methylcitrate dehydratase PrpD
MSIQYNVAAALLTGNFDEANYRPLDRPDICDLASSIEIRQDHALTIVYPRRQAARVRIDLSDGRRLRHELDDVRGADDLLVTQRFDAAATKKLGSAAARALHDRISKLEQAKDCRLISALRVVEEN